MARHYVSCAASGACCVAAPGGAGAGGLVGATPRKLTSALDVTRDGGLAGSAGAVPPALLCGKGMLALRATSCFDGNDRRGPLGRLSPQRATGRLCIRCPDWHVTVASYHCHEADRPISRRLASDREPPGGRRDIRANGRRMAQAKLSDTTPLHNLQARCQT